jgi:poly(3-hydroxyalkanoate) synthetase
MTRGSSAAFSSEGLAVAKACMDLSAHLLVNPYRLAQAQMEVVHAHRLLWQQAMLKAMGLPSQALVEPDSEDLRFSDPAWKENFLLDFIKQSYLITTRHLQQTVTQVEGLDEASQRQVRALTQQYIDSLSPTNFVLTNPEVLREILHSKGRNLVDGLKNLLGDRETGDGLRGISAGPGEPRLVEVPANTRGKVIFQNPLIQLLHFDPTTPRQYKIPLLLVPPWRNGYYLLNLRQDDSFVKWASEQGFTTFMVSWLDANQAIARATFEDCLADGAVAAIRAVEQATGVPRIHLAGYCLGGTLVMSLLARMAAMHDRRAASGSFLGAMIELQDLGEGGGADGPEVAWVTVPCYFLSTIDDHVSPWKRSYRGARLPSGPVRFVLGGSSDIAGVVHPPSAKRHGYWTNEVLSEEPDDFLAGAVKHRGSWWDDWRQWLLAQPDGDLLVPARLPGDAAPLTIEDPRGSDPDRQQ